MGGTPPTTTARPTSSTSAPRRCSAASRSSRRFGKAESVSGPCLALYRGMVVQGFNVKSLLKKTAREIREDGVFTLAAGAAFYAFFTGAAIVLVAGPWMGLANYGAGAIVVAIMLAGWSGSSMIGAVMQALNVAYDADETRTALKQHVL